MRGYAIASDVPYLTLLLATTALVHAVENVISIDLCPPYLPGCENTWTQAGAAVGDPCSAPCQVAVDILRKSLLDTTLYTSSVVIYRKYTGGWCTNGFNVYA